MPRKKNYDDEVSLEEVSAQVAPDYSDLAEENPERAVDLPEENEETRHRSMSESLDASTDLSDFQYAASMLLPGNLNDDNALDRLIMVSRIAPEAFLPLLQISVVQDIMSCDPKGKVNVIGSIKRYYGVNSIGLDGKGRIDIAELAGAAKEEKRMERALRDL